jgi:predicted nucleic acid-binding protein
MAMMNDNHIFVDTNVLIRATINTAPLHVEAQTKLDKLWQSNKILCISHQVIREYIANTTRPQQYSPAIPIEHVLNQIKNFRQSFEVLLDSPLVLNQLLELIRIAPVGGKQVHDANIVATMVAHDIGNLLTHNVKDFERYSTIIKILPLE